MLFNPLWETTLKENVPISGYLQFVSRALPITPCALQGDSHARPVVHGGERSIHPSKPFWRKKRDVIREHHRLWFSGLLKGLVLPGFRQGRGRLSKLTWTFGNLSRSHSTVLVNGNLQNKEF
jgi:hypothetical protein